MTLPSYSKGDVITCVLNTTERTLSFGLNTDHVEVAFRDVDTSKELHPCVMFYSSSTGEQVKISDFQVTFNVISCNTLYNINRHDRAFGCFWFEKYKPHFSFIKINCKSFPYPSIVTSELQVSGICASFAIY